MSVRTGIRARSALLISTAITLLTPVNAPANIFDSIKSAAGQITQGVKTGVGAALSGDNIVVGTVAISSPIDGYLTCFKDIRSGYISSSPITSPTQSQGTPVMIMTKTGLVTSAMCDDLEKKGLLGGGSGSSGTGAPGRPADYRNIGQTELNGFFEKYPQPGGGKIALWPRVAITLADAPEWHLNRTTGFNGLRAKHPTFACWKFVAKIWESAKQSRDVAPFYYCSGDILRIPKTGNSPYYVWSGIDGTALTRTTPGSTGIERTEGPNFPDSPLLMTKPYQRTDFADSFSAEIIAGILNATGMDFDYFEDHRLWLNLSSAVAPK